MRLCPRMMARTHGLPGHTAVVLEIDGDLFEVDPLDLRRERPRSSHAAVHRVLIALAQRDAPVVAALGALGLGCEQLELALRTGVLGVIQRSRPRARLDAVEYVDLRGLASA